MRVNAGREDRDEFSAFFLQLLALVLVAHPETLQERQPVIGFVGFLQSDPESCTLLFRRSAATTGAVVRTDAGASSQQLMSEDVSLRSAGKGPTELHDRERKRKRSASEQFSEVHNRYASHERCRTGRCCGIRCLRECRDWESSIFQRAPSRRGGEFAIHNSQFTIHNSQLTIHNFPHHLVMKPRPDLPDRLILSGWMHAVGQQDDIEIPLPVDPQRSTGEPCMANRTG